MAWPVANAHSPPEPNQLELALIGPGYGESALLHIGNGDWILVDSCMTVEGAPAALSYLESMGIDVARSVVLVVATHWHDDHIRGLTQILATCPKARFCLASALCQEEFIALAGALEKRHLSASGSGLRELFGAINLLKKMGRPPPLHAIANRVVHRSSSCNIWTLSPSDAAFQKFIRSIGKLVPAVGNAKIRIPSLSPNDVAVVLWVDCGGSAFLLGSDMERSGWAAIAQDKARPHGKASIFKTPHHGSRDADEPMVWKQMLKSEPVALMTPWRRGRGKLPTAQDRDRILGATSNAWITHTGKPPSLKHKDRTVARQLRESGVRIRELSERKSLVRARRSSGQEGDWTVEAFGSAGPLVDYAV